MIALRLESNYVLDGTWLQVACRRSAQGLHSVTFFDARVTVHWKAPPHPLNNNNHQNLLFENILNLFFFKSARAMSTTKQFDLEMDKIILHVLFA